MMVGRAWRERRWHQIPAGTRDLLPGEAARVRRLEAGLRETFARWGFQEVATPALEYLEAITRGAGVEIQDRLFKLVDSGGEILVLRPEMTVPIARLVATRLGAEPLPLRLSYVAPVFRGQEAGRLKQREFVQAGVELIGAPGIDADAEVVAVGIAAMQEAGVADFTVGIGHIGYLRGLLEAAALPEEAEGEVRELLYRQDFVGLRDRLGMLAADRAAAEAILTLPTLRGRDALARAALLGRSPACLAALAEVEELLEVLRAYGGSDAVYPDLGIIRDFDYYSGVVFEGYSGAVGYPLLGGGRYDHLLGLFGDPRPATGFALSVDRLLSSLPAEERGAPSGALVRIEGGARDAALALARRLRGRQVTVHLEVTRRTWEEACLYARDQGLAVVVEVAAGGARLFEVEGGREQVLSSLEEVEARMSHPRPPQEIQTADFSGAPVPSHSEFPVNPLKHPRDS